MFNSINELASYRSMIYTTVRKEIRGRYKGSALGFIWNFVLPIVQIMVYVVVFTAVFKQNITDYYVYLIAGMVPWIMFAESIGSGAGCIVNNSNLITKIYFPHTVIPISIVLSKLVNFLISIGIILGILIVGGHGVVPLSLVSLPLAILLLTIFCIGISMIVAAFDVYLRDVEYMVNALLMVYIWLTPILYVKNDIDAPILDTIVSMNPLAYIIKLFQDILYSGITPNIETIMIAAIIAIITFTIGWLVFTKLSDNFAEVL